MKSLSTKVTQARKVRGRPRSFDRDSALERAMQLFWRQGYEATSLHDLTAAMGINPPSLYAAFGDKEHLFMEAVERYSCGPGGGTSRILKEEPTARGAIARLLKEAAVEMTRSCHPPGCMMVKSAANCSAVSARTQTALANRRTLFQAEIKARIERGIQDGELAGGTNAGMLANFYVTVIQGMSIQSIDGATRKSLLATGAAAMRAWPTKNESSQRGPES
jgi:TetR/AcrR family transcriptional regulator, copper-responsive repressor